MRSWTRRLLELGTALGGLLAGAAAVAAQEPPAADERTAPAATVGEAVERYFAEVSDDRAAALLDALLQRADLDADALLATVTTPPARLEGRQRVRVPHAGDALAVDVEVPARAAGERLPVLFAINWSSPPLADAVRARVIQAEVPGYTPPQFSDVGRDAHLKILRTVAFLAGGDPDALWWTGYSWGGHACWDVALHRPGVARGFVGRGGGPRRTFCRLLPNLDGGCAFAVCGAKDDPELVWTLRELRRRADRHAFDYRYWEAPDSGHDQPLPGEAEAGRALLAAPRRAEGSPSRGTLLADGAFVEHPLVRVLEVDEQNVAVPDRVRVSARASADDQRRALLDALAKQVASVSWRVDTKGETTTFALTAKGVRRATLFLREPWCRPGTRVVVRAGKTRLDETLAVDPRALLEHARRTGERLRPAWRAIDVRF